MYSIYKVFNSAYIESLKFFFHNFSFLFADGGTTVLVVSLFAFFWVLCVGQLLEIIGQFISAASTTALLSKFIQKAVKIILVITKIEAKKLAEKGLRLHTDLFTGKWKRRRYYLRENWEGRNIKLLNEIRGIIVK